MSGIAEVLLNLKYPVSGSDLKSTSITRALKKKGARIHYGHKAHNLGDAEVVVLSSAVKPNNPEVLAAKERKLLVIQRADMLAELMRFSKYGVAVSGTHGKTTTTSLVASVLDEGGLDPTIIIGGRVNSLKSNARLGRGEFMVAESDESDGSFLKLSPAIAVITNIDREHMDYYGDFEKVKEAYLQFAYRVPFYGAIIACLDHPVVREILPKIEKRIVTYGFSEEAHFVAKNVSVDSGRMTYDFFVHGENRGKISLNIPGRHNVLNSLAALAVGEELGVPLIKRALALKKFKGIQRRCEVLLKNASYTVLDDYGHHPEEIKATLKAIKEVHIGRRLVCLFQPHRYSRTQDLFGELIESFENADLLFVTDIYTAGEAPIEGITSARLVDALQVKRGATVHYVSKGPNLIDEVLKFVQPGDIFLSLGAGDVTKMGRECAKRLKRTSLRGA